MYSIENALSFYTNKHLFEEIHQAKNAFIALLENISNKIDRNELNIAHSPQKGIKISKGNELEHCPYQVLDVIRDFDANTGLNIRILHWWGYGLFLFTLIGKDYFYQEERIAFFEDKRLRGFMVSETSSPFHYKKIIEDYEMRKKVDNDVFPNYFNVGRIQLVKSMHYGGDFSETERIIFGEIDQILQLFKNFKKK